MDESQAWYSVPAKPLIEEVFASTFAPMQQAIRAHVAPISGARRHTVADVTCPQCEKVLALLVRGSQRLYLPGADGALGAPLSSGAAERVPVRCDRCRTTFNTSGRGVARRLREGEAPLA